MQKQKLELGLPGYSYADLYDPAKLRTLFETWHHELHAADAALGARYDSYRATQGADLTPQALSDLLVELTPSVSGFLARLKFRVEDEAERAAPAHRRRAARLRASRTSSSSAAR